MEKRSLLGLFLTIVSINFASAQFYGSFSLGNFLNSIDPSTMILGVIFVVSFALLQFALSKYFKEQKTIATVISFALSMLIIWGINQSGFDYGGYFYNFFFFLPTGFIDTLWPLLLLAGWIYFIVRSGFILGSGKMLVIMGLLLNVIAFSGISYQPSTPAAIGVFLIIVGAILWIWGAKKKVKQPNSGRKQNKSEEKRQRREGQSKNSGFFRRSAGRAWKGAKKSAGWFGRKAQQTGQEWTRRDNQWRSQRKKTKWQQRKEQKRAEREYKKQENKNKNIEEELGDLKKEYNHLQRKYPSSPRLREIVKRIKELRKQKKS